MPIVYSLSNSRGLTFLRIYLLYPLARQRLTSKWSMREYQLYKFCQLITYHNVKYGSVGRISASNFILSDLIR